MKPIPRALSALDTFWGAVALLALVALIIFGCMGCAAPEDFVQPGDSFAVAVEKQGPVVGIQRECAPEGELHVLLAGGFVVAVFDAKYTVGYWPATTAPVMRVDLDWRALPRAPMAEP